MLHKRIVMCDLEMTGVNCFRDEILQIAMVKCELDKKTVQYKPVGEVFNIHLHSSLSPTKPFHHEHLTEAYKKSNASNIGLLDARRMVRAFLAEDGWLGLPISGDCVTTDLMFLVQNKIVDLGDYDEKDNHLEGTFDYRILDINPIGRHMRSLGCRPFHEVQSAKLKAHDALNDCFNQIEELNYYLKWSKYKLEIGLHVPR